MTEFTEGIAYIQVDPADTKELSFLSYVYDIQLTEADGTVTTIIPKSNFNIKEEVTYD